ncbi:MAG: ATPase [Thermoplasmata archaeon]|nr:MAG: ATPase [Thermoplasmata archaeon]
MPKIVVKRDGKEEEFIPEKIVVSMDKGGASLDKAREVADEIKKIDKERIETKEIREKILERMRAENPLMEKKWLAYDKSVKRLYRHYRQGLYE